MSQPNDGSFYLESLHVDGQALLDAAQRAPDGSVPGCPAWTMTELLGHTSGAHRWASHVLEHGATYQERVLPDPPTEFEDLVSWYQEGLTGLENRFAATGPGELVWTPTAGVTGSVWWRRKMAVETALHRWDAQQTAGVAAPVVAAVATGGIDEFVGGFLPGMLQFTADPPSGVVRLSATDIAATWTLDLDRRDSPTVLTDASPSTTLTAPASDLLLWTWNRLSDPHASLQVTGPDDVVEQWTAMRI
jgi:uncharacterized protein (TIGR03083 family)